MRRLFPVEKVILFGSRARGTAQKDPDVDLLVVVTYLNKEIRESIIDAAFDTSVEEDVDVIALPCSLAEYNSPLFQADHFYRNIQKEGVLFS